MFGSVPFWLKFVCSCFRVPAVMSHKCGELGIPSQQFNKLSRKRKASTLGLGTGGTFFTPSTGGPFLTAATSQSSHITSGERLRSCNQHRKDAPCLRVSQTLASKGSRPSDNHFDMQSVLAAYETVERSSNSMASRASLAPTWTEYHNKAAAHIACRMCFRLRPQR